jgi:hypothetical protein
MSTPYTRQRKTQDSDNLLSLESTSRKRKFETEVNFDYCFSPEIIARTISRKRMFESEVNLPAVETTSRKRQFETELTCDNLPAVETSRKRKFETEVNSVPDIPKKRRVQEITQTVRKLPRGDPEYRYEYHTFEIGDFEVNLDKYYIEKFRLNFLLQILLQGKQRITIWDVLKFFCKIGLAIYGTYICCLLCITGLKILYNTMCLLYNTIVPYVYGLMYPILPYIEKMFKLAKSFIDIFQQIAKNIKNIKLLLEKIYDVFIYIKDNLFTFIWDILRYLRDTLDQYIHRLVDLVIQHIQRLIDLFKHLKDILHTIWKFIRQIDIFAPYKWSYSFFENYIWYYLD